MRQELRNVVNVRTQQNSGIRTPQSPHGLSQGSMVGNTNNNNGMNMALPQQQIPGTPILNTPPDQNNLGFNFDLGQPGN